MRQRWQLALLVFGLTLLHAPSLRFGFFVDDYVHQAVLDGLVEHPTLGPWSLYDWGTAPTPGNATYDSGAWVWWLPQDWKVRFFRPLTSASIALDHALYGGEALGYAFTGLLLFVALLLAVHRFYRMLGLPPRTALLALAVFGLEDGSAISCGWIANRSSPLEVLFGAAALGVLAGARERPVVAGAGAFVLAALACLCKESGVAVFLVIAAFFALAPTHGVAQLSRRARRIGIGLALACAGAFVAFLVQGGYGSSVGFYPTPWGAPLAYAARALQHLTVSGASLMGPIPTDLVFTRPELRVPFAIVGGVMLALLAPVAWRGAARHPAARFLAAWVVLTALPNTIAPPSDRLLLGPMVGAAGLLALAFEAARAGATPSLRVRVLRLTAIPLSGIMVVVQGLSFASFADMERVIATDADVGAPELGRREVFLLQSPTAIFALQPALAHRYQTGDPDLRFWTMQMGRRGLVWTRVDERTFELSSTGDAFLTQPFESIFTTRDDPPEAGRQWRTSLFTVEAAHVDASGLRRIRVRLEDDMDEPRYRFLVWKDGRLVHLPPPRPGESLEIDAALPPIPFSP